MRNILRLNSARGRVMIVACLLAIMLSTGAMQPVGRTNRSCGAACYDRFYNCIVSGRTVSYCQSQLSYCLANCGSNP